MKFKTLMTIQKLMDADRVRFHDNGEIEVDLTSERLCDIIEEEYGTRPDSEEEYNKSVERLFNDLLDHILPD